MLKQLEADPRFTVHLGEELVAIEPAAGARPLTMRFASGLSATAGALVLNLPQLPLLRVLSASEGLLVAAGGMPVALQAPRPTDGAKLYIHYANAWWRNLLGRSSGEFSTGSGTMVNATANTQLPELFGRYHDGHTRCDGPTAQTRCRGFLEATYTYAENVSRVTCCHPRCASCSAHAPRPHPFCASRTWDGTMGCNSLCEVVSRHRVSRHRVHAAPHSCTRYRCLVCTRRASRLPAR